MSNLRVTRRIELLATVLSLTGAVLNVLKLRESFLVWLVANALWVVLGCRLGRWPLVATFTAFFLTALWGWCAWG